MEIFVVEVGNVYSHNTHVIGVYTTFDKAVNASDAYTAWFGASGNLEFFVTRMDVDFNHDTLCTRNSTFELRSGVVPAWCLNHSAFKDRYTENSEPTHTGGCE